MITARSDPQSRAMRKLEAKAALLAAAHAERTLRARRSDPVRWRMARLLWPLLTGDR
jgi:hypothetical protein